MKFKGQSLELARGKVIIPKNGINIEINVVALPLGTEGKPRELFPSPPVPTEIVMKGKRAVLDPNGKIMREPNYDDPEFVKQATKASRLQMVYLVYHSIKDDPNLEFATKEEDCASEQDFYLKIYDELSEAGFTVGDIGLIQKEILKISNIDAEAIEERVNDFLSDQPDGAVLAENDL